MKTRSCLMVEALEERALLAAGSFSVAQSITNSEENLSNLVKANYDYFLGREADQAGLDYWVDRLTDGWSQEQVEALFLGSNEYIQAQGGTQAAWIEGLYLDMLGRSPGAPEINSWLAALQAGVRPTDIAFGFTASEEREGIVVTDYYEAYLGRTPSDGEVAGWVDVILDGTYREDVVAQFVASAEYYLNSGGTYTAWIQQVYQDVLLGPASDEELTYWRTVLREQTLEVAQSIANSEENFGNIVHANYDFFLGREADAAGLAYWVDRLSAGWSQEQVEASFLASPEYIAAQGGTQAGWIQGLYLDMLGRSAGQSEVNSWLAALAAGVRHVDIAFGFTASEEREFIVVADYYAAYLGREASDQEITFWVGKLLNGQLREDIVAQFISSDEYYIRNGDDSELWLHAIYQDVLAGAPTQAEIDHYLPMLS